MDRPRGSDQEPDARRARAPDPAEGDLDALTSHVREASRRVSGAIAGTTVIVLHGLAGYLTLTLRLVAPLWAVAALLAVWAAIGVTAWRWRARRPLLAMLAPFVAVALDLAVVSLGSAALGWTA